MTERYRALDRHSPEADPSRTPAGSDPLLAAAAACAERESTAPSACARDLPVALQGRALPNRTRDGNWVEKKMTRAEAKQRYAPPGDPGRPGQT